MKPRSALKVVPTAPIVVPIDEPIIAVAWEGDEWLIAFHRRDGNCRAFRTVDDEEAARRLVLLQHVHEVSIGFADSARRLLSPFRRMGGGASHRVHA